MGMYDYGQRGTHINGFLTYIANNNPSIRIEKYSQLNEHLKAIRLLKEPNKPVSNNCQRNATYIQDNYDWKKDVIPYFKSLNTDHQ